MNYTTLRKLHSVRSEKGVKVETLPASEENTYTIKLLYEQLENQSPRRHLVIWCKFSAQLVSVIRKSPVHVLLSHSIDTRKTR